MDEGVIPRIALVQAAPKLGCERQLGGFQAPAHGLRRPPSVLYFCGWGNTVGLGCGRAGGSRKATLSHMQVRCKLDMTRSLPWRVTSWYRARQLKLTPPQTPFARIYFTHQLFTNVPSTNSALRQRDAAFESEAIPWIDDVYRFALSLTRDESDADDIVQDTFLRAFRSWHTYLPGSDCRRWLFTICRNVFLRSRERARPTVELETTEIDAAAAGSVYANAVRDGLEDVFA